MKMIMKLVTTSVIAISLTACNDSEEITKPVYQNDSGNSQSNKSEIIEGSIVPSLTEKEQNGEYYYSFELKNISTEPVTLTMNTAQLYDYQLINEKGTVVYTYSDNKYFAQMLQEKTIQPGESLKMDVDASEGLETLQAGTYTLKVWSTANESKDWTVTTKVDWNGAGGEEETIALEEADVYFNLLLPDKNSIRVINNLNRAEVMLLSEEAKAFYADELKSGTEITVFYVIVDGKKVIQSTVLR